MVSRKRARWSIWRQHQECMCICSWLALGLASLSMAMAHARTGLSISALVTKLGSSAVLNQCILNRPWSQKLVTGWSQEPKSAAKQTSRALSEMLQNGPFARAPGTKNPAITRGYLTSSNGLICQGKWWYGCSRTRATKPLYYTVLGS